ncbi:hypothetical protein GUJ93_ZPchr2170g33344 [Zizania palustris]|uniref:Reverse transcriptase zinc-binding domain-containing protein n=1 Tax=Zizania palustris TaxID=103762 RepID=A0A8J5V230_ZIZPA|nr:hypothetical protein GUJ93_ZPchr2170g33349 [Zizania palustris]KAG8042983.1 hypothetical protein GUJ93_ZPchr2170g33344 [Zizania palustris]
MKKYVKNKTLAQMDSKNGDSQFWRFLMKIKPLYRKFCVLKIGNGKKTSFWLDSWIGARPLAHKYPDLFYIALNKNVTVAEVLDSDFARLKFRRDLIGSIVVTAARRGAKLPSHLLGEYGVRRGDVILT